MKEQANNSSSIELEVSYDKSDSPDSLSREQNSISTISPTSKAWICNIKRCAFLLILIISSSLLISYTNSQIKIHRVSKLSDTQPDEFNFLVYCPMSYYTEDKIYMPSKLQQNDQKGEIRRRLLYPSQFSNVIQDKNKSSDKSKILNLSRTFHVEVHSYEFTDSNGKKSIELFYCSLVRNFYDTCDQSYIGCSSPGPMFDVPAREHIDVVWINALNSSLLPASIGDCMNSAYAQAHIEYCSLMAKLSKAQTFYDPTEHSYGSHSMPQMKTMPIDRNHWPMTTHVHGAEIRPAFDGNPLSWTNNNQNDSYIGLGSFTIGDKCYFDCFQSIDSKSRISSQPPQIQVVNYITGKATSNQMYKINRYPNLQNPGMLWYHDHSMHVTSFNVGNGLSGFYILRDKEVEAKINVPIKYQKLVMFTVNGLMGKTSLSQLQHSTVYRFKFLNNNFNDLSIADVLKISFSYNECLDPYQLRENFTIIGADSSLFNNSIDYQTSFVLAQAERIELLIIFNKNKGNISICGDPNLSYDNPIEKMMPHLPNIQEDLPNLSQSDKEILKLFSSKGIKLVAPKSQTSKAVYKDITKISLDVPFTNLSQIEDSKIAVKRMRPLIWMGQKTFTINGRASFHQGKSENPTIGTVEDWFLINTIFFSHPIHVHLINFQVVASYDVRFIVLNQANPFVNCALYELDFILTALETNPSVKSKYKDAYGGNGAINYTYLCLNRNQIQTDQQLQYAFNSIFPEDSKDPITRISGMNAFSKISSFKKSNYDNLVLNPPINWQNPSQMIYISPNNDLDVKPYYRRWKDTSYVDGFKMLQLRMRWTKSQYNQTEDKPRGSYFHIPVDQVRQYPGYVYHCHILTHEDNEMMRPIMLQLPSDYQLDSKVPCNYDEKGNPLLKWSDKYQCINNRCGNMRK